MHTFMHACLLPRPLAACPHSSAWADRAGAHRAAVPREQGAHSPASWPLPRRSFSAAARTECPVAPGGVAQPCLPTIGPVGSGQGQPLPRFLPAHLPCTPVLCLPQSQQPTPGPQTILCTDVLRPVPAIQGSWEACGDSGLQPGQRSDGELTLAAKGSRGMAGRNRQGECLGGGGGLGPFLCAREWGGNPLTPEP